jgi:protein-S-isoprenylcysteine O-methyltransferase Ste14
VPKGKSYVTTTKLVDTGIYAIVRHPQFLAGMLWSLAFILIAQHWLVLVLGIPIILIWYLGIIEGDKSGIEKFGDDYKRYMQRVPQMNFLVGLIRVTRRTKKPPE